MKKAAPASATHDGAAAAAAAAQSGDDRIGQTVIEWLPRELRYVVLEFLGADEWLQRLPPVSQALRDLCAEREMRDALKRLRKWAMALFKRGMDMWHRTNGAVVDFEGGKALVMRAASAGLRPAKAECFCEGWGTSRDYAKAAALWQAELDDSASETEASGGACSWSAYRLAGCYRNGLGVERDYARAFEFYIRAVETDENGRAMYHLYLVDYARAVSWLRKSADSGYSEACYRLGGHLERGELGVDVDLKEALRYYEKADEQTTARYFKNDIARVRAAIAAQPNSNEDAE